MGVLMKGCCGVCPEGNNRFCVESMSCCECRYAVQPMVERIGCQPEINCRLRIVARNPLDFKGVRVLAQTRAFSSDLGESHYHSVELSDLEPNCIYAYRVGDGVNWTEWQHFRTAKQESAPFSFIYFGDAQNDIRMHWSRVFRESFRLAPDAAFTLHAGDLINHAQNDADCGSRCSMPSRWTW